MLARLRPSPTRPSPTPGPAHLAQVVEVVLAPHPAVACGLALSLGGDVPGVSAFAVVKLPFEELTRVRRSPRGPGPVPPSHQTRPRTTVSGLLGCCGPQTTGPRPGHPWASGARTCTPRMPKMMKKAQQMSTMFPMGLSDDIRVSTTNLRPGARLMTLDAEQRPVPDRSPQPPQPPPLPPASRNRSPAPPTSGAAASAADAAHAGCPGSWRHRLRPWLRRCRPGTPGPAARPAHSSCSAGRRAPRRPGPGPPPGRRRGGGAQVCRGNEHRRRGLLGGTGFLPGLLVPSPSSRPRKSP